MRGPDCLLLLDCLKQQPHISISFLSSRDKKYVKDKFHWPTLMCFFGEKNESRFPSDVLLYFPLNLFIHVYHLLICFLFYFAIWFGLTLLPSLIAFPALIVFLTCKFLSSASHYPLFVIPQSVLSVFLVMLHHCAVF